MTDYEIAKSAKLKDIRKVGKSLGCKKSALICYGKNMAKVESITNNPNSKLILVTAINPTPAGEGKTTVAIGLADALKLQKKKVCLALREPSLGPVFGMKGGACGGGQSQVAPMEEINLHFTGDFHAVTSANNLLCALVDNHIFQGNSLGIREVIIKRCIDMNDRALREITISQEKLKNNIPRQDGFVITSACEIMAILCFSRNMQELKARLGNIIIGYDKKDKPIFAKALGAEQAMAIILKEALKPNLVQSLMGTPALVHCGPFANIAHGCNSSLATLTALNHADYVVTEAGFGSDLGGEKFLDIKCRMLNLVPGACVLTATIRALRHHGGAENYGEANLEAVKKGVKNLEKHIMNLTNLFKVNTICAINKFENDTREELEFVKNFCKSLGVMAVVIEPHSKGGKGCLPLSDEVVKLCDTPKNLEYVYELSDTLLQKTQKICQKVYGAKKVMLSEKAKASLKKISSYAKDFYVCIAKTQYSLSGDAKLLGAPSDFAIEIRDFEIRHGAGFVVAIAGDIMLMPGLGKLPAALRMKIDDNGDIQGLF